jgi:pantothenate kinase-related protein Tda10
MTTNIYQQFHNKNNNNMVVGLQGYQGVGKTSLAKMVKTVLQNQYGLKTVCISIDDVYKKY